MSRTNHLAISLLEQSQAQKDVTVNEALARIDAVLNTGAISLTLATPPASPSEGDVYIVADSAQADWQGQEANISYFDGGVWRFVTPRAGMQLWVGDEAKAYTYVGGLWVAETNQQRGHDQAQYHRLKTLTDATTISWDVRYYSMAEVTLEGSRMLQAPTNAVAGGVYHLIVKQDATGGHQLSFDSAYAFAGATAPSLAASSHATNLLRFVFDGQKMLGSAIADLS